MNLGRESLVAQSVERWTCGRKVAVSYQQLTCVKVLFQTGVHGGNLKRERTLFGFVMAES